MISFYPGPSRVDENLPRYMRHAYDTGILSMSHRSPAFMRLYESTVSLLNKKLNVPSDYSVYFFGSATECWEVIAQSLTTQGTVHIYNGAFGEKWHQYTQRLTKNAEAKPFDPNRELDTEALTFSHGDVICVTQNETSNGTQVAGRCIAAIRQQNPSHLIAVDATSSMAGVDLNFKDGDVWFASVQKCFGLPAGLALMVCSPAAVAKIRERGEREHYNSLLFTHDMMEKWQTPYTPNVLAIYLLMRVLKSRRRVAQVEKKVTNRYHRWCSFLRKNGFHHHIDEPAARSYTVLTIAGDPEWIKKTKVKAVKKGLLLGEGYGSLKETTFRIANFPVIRKKEINKLMEFLASHRP